jgi:hypothetical protein
LVLNLVDDFGGHDPDQPTIDVARLGWLGADRRDVGRRQRLIFERIREEFNKGSAPRMAIRNGFAGRRRRSSMRT